MAEDDRISEKEFLENFRESAPEYAKMSNQELIQFAKKNYPDLQQKVILNEELSQNAANQMWTSNTSPDYWRLHPESATRANAALDLIPMATGGAGVALSSPTVVGTAAGGAAGAAGGQALRGALASKLGLNPNYEFWNEAKDAGIAAALGGFGGPTALGIGRLTKTPGSRPPSFSRQVPVPETPNNPSSGVSNALDVASHVGPWWSRIGAFLAKKGLSGGAEEPYNPAIQTNTGTNIFNLGQTPKPAGTVGWSQFKTPESPLPKAQTTATSSPELVIAPGEKWTARVNVRQPEPTIKTPPSSPTGSVVNTPTPNATGWKLSVPAGMAPKPEVPLTNQTGTKFQVNQAPTEGTTGWTLNRPAVKIEGKAFTEVPTEPPPFKGRLKHPIIDRGPMKGQAADVPYNAPKIEYKQTPEGQIPKHPSEYTWGKTGKE